MNNIYEEGSKMDCNAQVDFTWWRRKFTTLYSNTLGPKADVQIKIIFQQFIEHL